MRNLFACIAFALVPAGLIKHPEVTNWGAQRTEVFVVAGLSASIVLVIWNVIYSGLQLHNLFATKGREWLLLSGLLMLFLSGSLLFFAVAVAVRFV